ncbi:RRS1-domain-containing protein [Pterulicium gracile]|uniref:Ribosome biogenesis regulatory protein n=1 Tax=Pterulicium gracile TaxID=1884261 RepID=A0A5C3QV09_9AGAR|nr:RRS1-domain-containing protein [Pterula gracilis]
MDVSDFLASHAAKSEVQVVDKEIPLTTDLAFLSVFDTNTIDEESHKCHLQSLANDGVQTLLVSLFKLPTTQTPDGPMVQLPQPTVLLPRAKPLPKPKPPTKWEQFAKAKGIQNKKRDKKVWDEERQEWVNRWGKDGLNKQKEQQWITEVPMNADIDHDPVKEARDARKARVAKNERQKLQNDAAAAGLSGKAAQEERKKDIDRTLSSSRISTASMGKFDKKLDGEKKIRGVKRKFEPAEGISEKDSSLSILKNMESDSRKTRTGPAPAEESVINTRKAVRFASKGRGGLAMARGGSAGRGGRGRGGKR